MFFGRRKILKAQYEDVRSSRERFENFLQDELKDIAKGKWLEYLFIEQLHYLNHSGEFHTLKSKLELEERKLKFLKYEFGDRFEEFDKVRMRNDNINELLKE